MNNNPPNFSNLYYDVPNSYRDLGDKYKKAFDTPIFNTLKKGAIELFEYSHLVNGRRVFMSQTDALNQRQFIRTVESVKAFI